MSGRSYGAIKVTNEHNEGDDNEVNESAATSEEVPLLSTPTPEDILNTTAEKDDSRTSIGIQTDPSLLSSARTFLQNNALPQSRNAVIATIKNSLSHFWSDLTFDWISPLLDIGNAQGQLNVEDLDSLPLPKDCRTNEVYEKFLECWEEELEKAKTSIGKLQKGEKLEREGSIDTLGDGSAHDNCVYDEVGEVALLDDYEKNMYNPNAYQPSLIRALARAFGADFLRAGLLKLVHDANLFVGPQVLNRLIQFLRDKDAPLSYGLGLMVIVTCSQIIMSVW